MSNCILVTGGAGFVGSAVVRRLLDRADLSVVVVDNLFNGKIEFLPESERLTFHRIDLRDAEAVSKLVRQVRPDVVIHLAALHFIPYCNQHAGETMDVNVTGTQNLLEACRQTPPRSLVAASSAAVYPIYNSANTEEYPSPQPTDIYGLSKWVNEEQMRQYAAQTKTCCAATRFFNIYGPRETNPHVLPEIIDQMLAGQTRVSLGNVKPKRDYVHVDDVARAVIGLAEKNSQSFRTFNVGTGTEYSVEELVETLAQVSGLPIVIETDPERVRKSDRMHLLCDYSRIHQEIGWKPEYDLLQGLTSLWAWSQVHLAPQATSR